jgi:hypothetical protein
VRAGLFLSGLSDGALVAAVAFSTAVVAARLFGVALETSPWWLALLALPVGLGLWRSRRSVSGSSAHLDRRLGLSGLLLAAQERGGEAWEPAIRRRLEDAAEVLPRPRWRRLGARLLPGLAVATAVLLLPAPASSSPRARNPLLADALDRFEARLETAKRADLLRSEDAKEMERRVEEVRDRHEAGERVEWADVDALSDRLARERAEALARLGKAIGAAGDLARAQEDEATSEAAKTALDAVAQAGLLDRLPDDWAKRLGEAARGADGGEGAGDLAELDRLAQALAQAAGDRLDGLEAASALDPKEALDLRELVEAMRREDLCPT